jgi:hypothetical protein
MSQRNECPECLPSSLDYSAAVPKELGVTVGQTADPRLTSCALEMCLTFEVQQRLTTISDLSKEICVALSLRHHEKSAQLDAQLETELGSKERAMGALKQHRTEHGC